MKKTLLGLTIDDIRALAARVPGLNIETSNGRTQPRFYLRGLGNIDFDVNANQPVAMVFDDIYLENNTLRSLPLFDLEDHSWRDLTPEEANDSQPMWHGSEARSAGRKTRQHRGRRLRRSRRPPFSVRSESPSPVERTCG